MVNIQRISYFFFIKQSEIQLSSQSYQKQLIPQNGVSEQVKDYINKNMFDQTLEPGGGTKRPEFLLCKYLVE